MSMNFTSRVQEFIENKGKEYLDLFISMMTEDMTCSDTGEEIKSPIEQLFFISWRFNCEADPEIKRWFDLIPQYEDDTTSPYRLDFCLDWGPALCMKSNLPAKLFVDLFKDIPLRVGIEIDSHQWHEKTPRQAEYGKKRDRFLSAAGWKILHFTGTETYRDPDKVVEEVVLFCKTEYRKAIAILEKARGSNA
jgi:hypothetical protein